MEAFRKHQTGGIILLSWHVGKAQRAFRDPQECLRKPVRKAPLLYFQSLTRNKNSTTYCIGIFCHKGNPWWRFQMKSLSRSEAMQAVVLSGYLKQTYENQLLLLSLETFIKLIPAACRKIALLSFSDHRRKCIFNWSLELQLIDFSDPFVCDTQPPETHQTSLIWEENSCCCHVVAGAAHSRP